MRVTVDVDDLVPALGDAGGAGADAGRRRRRGADLERRRRSGSSARGPSRRRSTCAGARVDEALEALDRYLDDAALAGLDKATDHPRPGDGRPARRGPRRRPAAIRW